MDTVVIIFDNFSMEEMIMARLCSRRNEEIVDDFVFGMVMHFILDLGEILLLAIIIYMSYFVLSMTFG
jgi:hypothetical protein